MALTAMMLLPVAAVRQRAGEREQLRQETATDELLHYQATRAKMAQLALGTDLLQAISKQGDRQKAQTQEKHLADEQSVAKKYEEQSKEILERFKAADDAAEGDGRRVDHFYRGEAFLEIGIVLCAIAIVLPRAYFWWAALLSGFAGAAAIIVEYLHTI